MRNKPWWIVIVALLTSLASAQVREEAEEESAFDRIRRQAGQMLDGLRQFDDWETHYQYQISAIEDIYEQNGWDSEADVFSLELMREVEQIPPWEIQERFTTVFGVISDRYLLDEKQERTLKGLIFQENRKLFSKHSGRIMEYAMEAIQTRVAGEPFTPDQVARWTELAEPVFLDSRKSFATASEQFLEVLDPEQQELVMADIDAANKRMDSFQQLAGKWKRGEWEASDWGLARDPIQNPDGFDKPTVPVTSGVPMVTDDASKAALERAREAREQAREEAWEERQKQKEEDTPPPPPEEQRPKRPGKETKGDGRNDEWGRYVKQFIARYKLTDDQQQKAWLFYDDARKRAETTAKRIGRVAGDESDPRAKARMDAARKQVSKDKARLFERMKTRLERLPTRAQRRDAGPEKKAKP